MPPWMYRELIAANCIRGSQCARSMLIVMLAIVTHAAFCGDCRFVARFIVSVIIWGQKSQVGNAVDRCEGDFYDSPRL